MKKSRFAAAIHLTCIITAVLFPLLFALADFTGVGALKSLAITVFTVFYHFTMRLVVGMIVPRLMKNVDPETKLLAAGKREKAFYQKLGLKKHKANAPTYAPDLLDPKQHTMREIGAEMCRAEVVHIVIIPLSFVPIAFTAVWGAAAVFIITSVVAAFCDSYFVVIQRYNLARIQPILSQEKQRKQLKG